jgi:aminoglycoside phosphotransferase family enzyme
MSLPSIEQKVAFLSRPEIYPTPTRRVETKETHMAWVFLTDTQAWKLKKPVRYDYLDFSTPGARRKDCEAEVRLNRRLAEDVYYGVAPLTMNPRGDLELDGTGEAIDWLVKMRRLPAARFLDRAIADRTVSDAEARKVGALLARFYRQALPVAMTAPEYRKRLTDDIRANRRELAKPEYDLPVDLLESITRAQLEFPQRKPELFDDRVRAGKIIEAHGDLRPEHICLEREPVIIDCLEFNRDFRILDTASELAFLALECERLGAARVGELILETCLAQTGDRPPVPLLVFYQSYHACLRAKIAIWHLKDHQVANRAKWTDRARQYLNLAACINLTSPSSPAPAPEIPNCPKSLR